MSLQTKRCVSHLKAVECCIRCPRTYHFNGKALSARNSAFIADVYTLMAGVWFSVLPDRELYSPRWTDQLVGADVGRILEAFKAADSQLMEVGLDVVSFKHWRHDSYPDLGQVFRPIQVMVERCASFEGLRGIRTCLLFITRANFPEPIGLEEEAFEKWRAAAFNHAEAHPTEGELLFVKRLFPRKDIPRLAEDFIPRYGPGASADVDGTSLLSKYRNFRYDAGLRYFGQKVGFSPEDMPRHRPGLIRRGELRFVPKQLDRLRTITMEPSPLMFYQQGVFRFMNDRFHRIRSHICLEDASGNAELAWEGSLTGEYATIDLSHASDSVSYAFVTELFHDTCLREALAMTRSREVLYGDQVLTPDYFAPMGSALCFPVECCVFGAVVDAIMRDACDRRAWRVYGDDIVLPTDHAHKCMNRLVEMGFEVNQDKSFFAHNPGFRESCGGEFYCGADVTPVRVSRRFSGFSTKSPTAIEGWVDMANRLVLYPFARLRVLEELNRLNPPPIYSEDGEVGIFSKNPTNHRAKSRWNADLQVMEYKTGIIKSSPRYSAPEDDDIRYFEWHRSHANREKVDPVADLPTSIVTPGRPKWGPAWRSPCAGWVPEGAKAPGESRRGTGP